MVTVMGCIAMFIWLIVDHWGIAYIAVIGFYISLEVWEIIVLAGFSLMILSNSVLYLFIECPKPKRVIILRVVSLIIFFGGAAFIELLAPFGVGSAIALVSPVLSTSSFFILKALKKLKKILIEK